MPPTASRRYVDLGMLELGVQAKRTCRVALPESEGCSRQPDDLSGAGALRGDQGALGKVPSGGLASSGDQGNYARREQGTHRVLRQAHGSLLVDRFQWLEGARVLRSPRHHFGNV